MWTTSVSVFEISFGLQSLPDGKQKKALQEAFEPMLAEELEHHVLDFDDAVANRAGEISAKLHGLGRPVEPTWTGVRMSGTSPWNKTLVAWMRPFTTFVVR